MGVVGVLALIVEGGEPRCPPLRDILRISTHQISPLLGVELARESQQNFVGNPRVFAVTVLASPHEIGRPTRPIGHPGGFDVARGRRSGNVSNMGGGRMRPRLRGFPNRLMMQAVYRHTSTNGP